MSPTADAIVLAVLIAATSVWAGGYVAIMVVARVAVRVLDPSTRVDFFRALGRSYFWVGTPALVVALVTAGVLARDATGDGTFTAAVAVSIVLVLCFAVAVGQARKMTRLRQALARAPKDPALRTQVERGARAAGVLRGALGLLTLALVVLGSFLAMG